MSEQKYTLGNVMALASFVSDNSGSWIELNIGNHRGAGLLVWRMSEDLRSPKHEAEVRELIARANAYGDLLAASNAILSSFAYKPGTGPAWYEAARLAVQKAGVK